MKTQFQKDIQSEKIKGRALCVLISVGIVAGLWFGDMGERIFTLIISLFSFIFTGTMYNEQAIYWRVSMKLK